MPLEMLIKKTSDSAKIPSYAREGDAGLDLHSIEEKSIKPMEIERVKTGIALEIPSGFVGIVKDKSGLALQGIHCLAGVIDSGYRGELEIVAVNHGKNTFQIKKGQKIAQILILPFSSVKVREVENLRETERGKKGFGSTGRE